MHFLCINFYCAQKWMCSAHIDTGINFPEYDTVIDHQQKLCHPQYSVLYYKPQETSAPSP